VLKSNNNNKGRGTKKKMVAANESNDVRDTGRKWANRKGVWHKHRKTESRKAQWLQAFYTENLKSL